jgi:hypothetical protein
MHILSYLSPYIVRLYIDRLIKINKGLIYNIELNQDTYIGLTNKRILIVSLNKKIEIISYLCDIDVKNAIYSLKKNKYSLAKTIFYCGFIDTKLYDLTYIRNLILFDKYNIEEAYFKLMIFKEENEELLKYEYLSDDFYEENDETITGDLQIFINNFNDIDYFRIINIFRVRPIN